MTAIWPARRRCSWQTWAEKSGRATSRSRHRWRRRVRLSGDFYFERRQIPGKVRSPDRSCWSLSVRKENRRLRILFRLWWSSCWRTGGRSGWWGWRTTRAWDPESGRPWFWVPWRPFGLGRVCREGWSGTSPSGGTLPGRTEVPEHPENWFRSVLDS